MKTDVVSVAAPARLHLGFLDLQNESGRQLGGIGLALSFPATRVVMRETRDETVVEGPERTRARWHLDAMRSFLGIDYQHHHLAIESVIPARAGLGSGSQIAIAIAAALRTLKGMPLDPEGDAAFLGRGRRIGTAAGLFRSGGVQVDAGQIGDGGLPAIVARAAFPQRWRIILVLDPARNGLGGGLEAEAFRSLPPFPERDGADISRLTLMHLLPALAEEDIGAFGAAVRGIQARTGRHFAPAQGGGPFASATVAAALSNLQALGAHGIGQSSWGPTGFAFAPDAAQAEAWVAKLKADRATDGLDIRIVEGCNTGAAIDSRSPSSSR